MTRLGSKAFAQSSACARGAETADGRFAVIDVRDYQAASTGTCAAAFANVTTHLDLRRSACSIAATDRRGDEE